ncbi:MAG TPA: tagaturonate epimerase family protein [Spirochaetia bacterium]|nr:tagaturonate epimerase family protein [Spirochaetia bacterium]
MEQVARLLEHVGLLGADADRVSSLRGAAAADGPWIEGEGCRVYRRSLRVLHGVLYCIGADGSAKYLYAAGASIPNGFRGQSMTAGGTRIIRAPLSVENAAALHELFPFTAPVSLRDRTTTIGCGDRLGLATPGHLRALAGRQAAPVLAQQSVRELTLTGRNFPGVVADASFLVFQEGYEGGYGADGDHLKNLRDIDSALDAGMPMITLDLTEVMTPEPAAWTPARVDEAFSSLPAEPRAAVSSRYEGRRFELEGASVEISATEARRCALMYGKAVEFAAEVDRHLRARRGAAYDLEVSIDETTAPTLPSHHLYIASELQRRGVAVTSVAPRFVGEFQKGIDYIGDLRAFEEQFKVHCAIARSRGGYKVSIHSGSDKFSVYPAIGRHTGMRLHLKTAGTSWLEAVRVAARLDPALFRRIVAAAVDGFAEASRLYHVAADPAKVPDPSSIPDTRLEALVEEPNARQVLHIAYGRLLGDPGMRSELYRFLDAHEEEHYTAVERHIGRHVRLLGVPGAPAFLDGAGGLR